MMQRLTIRAEPELIQRVKLSAAQRGVSVSQFCRDAMRHELGPDEEQIQPPLTLTGPRLLVKVTS